MTDKDIEVIVKPIFTKMFNSNFSACEYGIECYKKGLEYQGIKELTIENDTLIKQVRKLEQQIEKMKNWCNCKNYQQCLIERIIRSKIDGSYKNKPVVVTLDKESENITNPFESLRNVVAFSCRDWSAEPEDAWIYGIIAGWGFDEDDGGKSCTDELERKFGSNKWSKSDTKRLKVLHNNWKLAKELFELFLEGHCQDKNRHENFRKKKENLIIRIIRKVKK